MSKFSCSCLNYNGYLHIAAEECYFASSFFRVTFLWSNVKRVKLDTKYIKGAPTSVLVIGLLRIVGADGEDGSASSRKRKKEASKKYFFYGFQDLLSAEERVKAAWHHWKQENSSSLKDTTAPNGSERIGEDSDCDSMTAQQADDVESGGSTRPGASTSVVTSRASPQTSRLRAGAVPDARTAISSPSTQRRSVTQPINRRHGGVDVLVPQTDSRLRKLAEQVLIDVARVFTRGLHFFAQGGALRTTLLVFLIFVLCVLAVTISQMRASLWFINAPNSEQTSLRETRQLLDALHHLFVAHRSMEQYASAEEYQQSMQAREVAVEPSTVWIARLERSAKELGRRFVHVQAEMLNLRGRRAERFMAAEMGTASFASDAWRRVFHEGDRRQRHYYLADPGAGDVEPLTVENAGRGSADEGGDGRTPSRRSLSFRRVRDDVRFWRRAVTRFAALIRYALPVGGGAATNLPSPAPRRPGGSLLRFLEDYGADAVDLVRYSEPFLDGFDIVQYVTREEAAERRECLRVSRELVQVSALVDDVLLGFTSLMSHVYEAVAAGVERPHFWGVSPTPATQRAGDGRQAPTSMKGMPHFTSEELLRVVFIRRYLDALLHLNPLEGSENRRRAESLAMTKRLQLFAEHDYTLSQRMNYTSKDAIQEAFYAMVLPAHVGEGTTAARLRSTLRNTLEEMKFWEYHEELWMEHLLHSLPKAQQLQLRDLAKRRRARARARAGARAANGKAAPTPTTRPSEGADMCTPGAGSTAEERLHCRRRVFWRDLPIFRGLLCFTPQPHLHRVTTAGSAGVGQAGQSAATAAAAEVSVDKGVRATDGEAVAALGKSADAPPLEGLQARHYSRERTAEEEFRSIFDTARVGNGVTTLKERWMWELYMFLEALTPVEELARTRGGGRRRPRAMHLENEVEGVDPELVESRARLLLLVERINRDYLPPIQRSASGFLAFLDKWLWPPTWLRHSLWRRGRHDEIHALRVMATADPAVQLAAAQIVEVPWGTYRDAPLILLKNVLLQPPELLKLRIVLHNRLMSSWLLLILTIITLGVVYVFF